MPIQFLPSGKLNHSHAMCYTGTFPQSSRLGPTTHCKTGRWAEGNYFVIANYIWIWTSDLKVKSFIPCYQCIKITYFFKHRNANVNDKGWWKKLWRKWSVKSLPQNLMHCTVLYLSVVLFLCCWYSCDICCSHRRVIQMMYASCLLQLKRLNSKNASYFTNYHKVQSCPIKVRLFF